MNRNGVTRITARTLFDHVSAFNGAVTIDASDLGWLPGHWPSTFEVGWDSGDVTTLKCIHVERSGDEILWAIYNDSHHLKIIKVLND